MLLVDINLLASHDPLQPSYSIFQLGHRYCTLAGSTTRNTLFPVTRPGILEEGRSVGARRVATPAELDMQLASSSIVLGCSKME